MFRWYITRTVLEYNAVNDKIISIRLYIISRFVLHALMQSNRRLDFVGKFTLKLAVHASNMCYL